MAANEARAKANAAGTVEAKKAADDAEQAALRAEDAAIKAIKATADKAAAEKAAVDKAAADKKAAEEAAEQAINDQPLIKGLLFKGADPKKCRDDFLASPEHELGAGCKIKPIAVDYAIPDEWKTKIPHYMELYQTTNDAGLLDFGKNDEACQKSFEGGIVPEWCHLEQKPEQDRDLGLVDPKLAGLKLSGPDNCKADLLKDGKYDLSAGCQLRVSKAGSEVDISQLPDYKTHYSVVNDIYIPSQKQCEEWVQVDGKLHDLCHLAIQAAPLETGGSEQPTP